MMRLRIFTCMGLVLLYPLSLFAQSPAAGAGPAGVPGAEQVGVAAAVRGGVELAREGQVGHVVSSGESVYLQDAISTDAQGTLQILLLDETAFTIGPNSSLVINRFVYDPKTDAGKVDARIVKGTFRFITGKIARKKPEDMTIALPAGTIGIRGTMAMGSVTGDKSLVVLTGPGKQNTTGNKQGELVVTNGVGNETKSVNLTKTGYGTVIEGVGKAPSDPFQVPEAQLQEMTQSLSPAGEGAGEQGVGEDSRPATEQAGQDQVDAGRNSSETQTTRNFTQSFAEESNKATQNSANAVTIQDGITKIQELLSIQTGQFHFDATSIPLFHSGSQVGTFNFQFDLDFGARTVGGGHSKVNGSASNINSGSPFQFDVPTESFENKTGDATHTYTGLTSGGCPSCSAAVTVTAKNSGGVIASNGDLALSLTQSSVTVTGSGNAGREAGLST